MTDDSAFAAALRDLLTYLYKQHYAFVTVTPSSHAIVLARNGVGRDLRDGFGWNRAFPRGLLPSHLEQRLEAEGVVVAVGELWKSAVRVSSLGDLLFAHSAFPTRDEDSVFFGPDTYRFAATVSRWLADRAAPARVVDVGCGSGAAGILIAKKCPEAEVTLADISEKALDFARVNAEATGADNVSIAHSDVFASLDGEFDLIVANPPYMVDPARRVYRDGGGARGVELARRILAESLPRLAPGGACLLYTGTPVIDGHGAFVAEATSMLQQPEFEWRWDEIDPDVFGDELANEAYADAERIAVGLLTVTKGDA